MTTSWKIAVMKRINATGLVVDVTYIFNAEEGNVLDRKVGSMTFSGSTDEPGFVPYEDLTEEIVLNWVFNSLGSEKTSIETEVTGRVQARYDEQQNNPYSQGVPWNN
jgi:hypothetical protein